MSTRSTTSARVFAEPPRPAARVFLLSPANLTGARGRRLLDGTSKAALAPPLHAGERVPLGDVYASVSSLYYRGKRAYASAFGRRGDGSAAALAITPTRGLVPDEEPVGLDVLRAFAAVDINPDNGAYRNALLASAEALDRTLDRRGEVVLLGSVASKKYVEPLAEVFGERLLFPRDFAGRGDMSRGGLLLRAAAAGTELAYVCALSAERRGPRPPRLGPRERS